MKKKAVNPNPNPPVVASVNESSNVASPSSPTSWASSSSSCVVDFHNHGVVDEKLCKLKRPRKRKSINGSTSTDISPIANPPPIKRRSSIYRGVTRWTRRFEAHLWDKSSWNNSQNKKGRQVYLGAYDSEVDAARTYDLAALKYWGPETTLNFPAKNYSKEYEEMQNTSKEEYLASLRRSSSGFSRGVSKYRGVARHHHNGRWEARIGRVFGNKYLYLGTFSSQEEAAAAYDLAAIEYRGANAVTNFDISNYIGRTKNHTPKTEPPASPLQTKDLPHQLQPVKQQREFLEEAEEKGEQQDLEAKTQDLRLEQQDKVAEIQHSLYDVQQEQTNRIMSSQFDKSRLPGCIKHTTMLEMDDPDGRENPWGFCLDMDRHLVPDIPLEEDGKLLDLFDQSGFEDNIDMIFEGERSLISLDATYIDGMNEIDSKIMINASDNLEKKAEILPKTGNLLSFYSNCSPLPSSTSSLVSCQL